MRKFILIIFISLLAAGCVSVVSVEKKDVPLAGQKIFLTLDQIKPGMLLSEIKALLPDKVTVGYKKNPQIKGGAEPIEIKEPYKVETVKSGDKTYDILYYFTSIRSADGLIADDELTPLVFDGNKLVGKGQDYLFKIKQKK